MFAHLRPGVPERTLPYSLIHGWQEEVKHAQVTVVMARLLVLRSLL
jgi:hypothetical protein